MSCLCLLDPCFETCREKWCFEFLNEDPMWDGVYILVVEIERFWLTDPSTLDPSTLRRHVWASIEGERVLWRNDTQTSLWFDLIDLRVGKYFKLSMYNFLFFQTNLASAKVRIFFFVFPFEHWHWVPIERQCEPKEGIEPQKKEIVKMFMFWRQDLGSME